MKPATFLKATVPVFLTIMCAYYYQLESGTALTYLMDKAFKESDICIAIKERIPIRNGSNASSSKSNESQRNIADNDQKILEDGYELRLIYTNRQTAADSCLEVVCMNAHGVSAMRALSESKMVDAYINGDIEIAWSADAALYESQIMSVVRLGYDDRFSWGLFSVQDIRAYLLLVYQAWIAQYMNNYQVSYDWTATHYTDGDLIISSFVDDRYLLYSHGIGFGPRLPPPAPLEDADGTYDYNYINSSRLSLDISLEDASENKLAFIVDACQLKAGSRVLDVGGGWGSFVRHAVPKGIHVHTLTISNASYVHLQAIAAQYKEREADIGTVQVSFLNFWELRDTALGQSLEHSFDAIVCIGTIEHLVHYDRLLESAHFYLKPGGFIHVDGAASKTGGNTNFLLQKYIFPGDTGPMHASAFFKSWENSKLRLVSVHADAEQYANTLYLWALKFERSFRNNSHPLSKITQRSYKIFQLYLWGCVVAYQHPITPHQAWRVVLQKPVV